MRSIHSVDQIISAPIVCRWYTKFHMETEQSVNTWFPRWCFYMFLPHTAQLLWPLWKFDGFLVGGSSIKMPFSGLPCSVNEENPLFLDHVRGERMDFHSYVSLLEGIPLVHVQKSHHVCCMSHDIPTKSTTSPYQFRWILVFSYDVYHPSHVQRHPHLTPTFFWWTSTFDGQRQHFGRFPRPNFRRQPAAQRRHAPVERKDLGTPRRALLHEFKKFQQFLGVRRTKRCGDMRTSNEDFCFFDVGKTKKYCKLYPPGKPFL